MTAFLSALLALAFVFCTPGVIASSPKDDVLAEDDGLWSMRADGTGRTRLTGGGATYDEASWSPDCRRIVFSR